MREKPSIGKYVCYGEEDGSFSWGRIKDEGTVNSPEGVKEVFVLTDRMTCRVAKNKRELKSLKAVCRKITAGTAGPIKLPGRTNPDSLPDYQQFGDQKKLPPKAASNDEPPSNPLVVTSTPEGQGLAPKLEEAMVIPNSKGLAILQQAGQVVGRVSGKKIDFLLRKFGYDTNVRKERLNLETDVVDVAIFGMDNFTDDELFLLAMQAKVDSVAGRLNQGMRNIIMLNAGGSEEDVAELAIETLKERRNIL